MPYQHVLEETQGSGPISPVRKLAKNVGEILQGRNQSQYLYYLRHKFHRLSMDDVSITWSGSVPRNLCSQSFQAESHFYSTLIKPAPLPRVFP